MVPDKIDRYEIKGEIGRGGMATVLHGYDPRFRRDVAIKLLPREFLHDPQFRARFQREAQTIASLEHPAIVPVHDFGEAGGQLYLVMRLMSSSSLSDRLEQGPLSISETIRILNRLAPALDSAHALGIIHRDLKPANILFDQWNNPYLSDFGIVKLIADSNTALTAVGGLMGTPSYMSPEQVRAVVKLDGRSDIYALGVILFEMLTGQQPYKANTPIGLAFMHVTEPIPRIQDSNPKLPANYQAVINQAMAKDREARPATATALATLVSDLARGEESTVEPPSTSSSENLDSFIAPAKQETVALQPQSDTKAKAVPPDGRHNFPVWVWVVAGLLVIIFIFGLSSLFGGGEEREGDTAVAVIATATPTESPTIPPTSSATVTPSLTPTLAPTEMPTNMPTSTPHATQVPLQIGFYISEATSFPFTLADTIENEDAFAELHINHDETVILEDATIFMQPNTRIEFENVTVDSAAEVGISLLLFEGGDIFLDTGDYENGADVSPIGDTRISFLITGSCLSVQYDQETPMIDVGCYEGVCRYRAEEREESTLLEEGDLLRYDLQERQVVEVRRIRASEANYYRQILLRTNSGREVYNRCVLPLFPSTTTPSATPLSTSTNTPQPPDSPQPNPPTNTPKPAPTNTPVIPSSTLVPTNTPVTPSLTPVVPTNTATPDDPYPSQPTSTPTSTPISTPVTPYP